MPTIGRGRVTAGTGDVTFRPGDEAASEQDGLLPGGGAGEPALGEPGGPRSIYARTVTGNNLGAGAALFRGTNGQLDVVLDFKSLVAGEGIEFDDSANQLRISATGGGTGGLPEIDGLTPGSYDFASVVVDATGRVRFARGNVAGDVGNAQNLGFGSPLFVNKQVGVLRFRSLRGDVGSGVQTSVVGDEVVIGVTGVVRSLTAVPGQGITITGSPVTGAGTLGIGLADSAVAPGTYTAANIVVDRFGRLTSATSGSLTANLTLLQGGTVVGSYNRLDIVGATVTEPVTGTARITVPAPPLAGLTNRAGTGAAVFAGISGGVAEFRRITGAGSASVVQTADEIQITVPPPPAPPVAGVANLAPGQGQVFDAIQGGIAGLRRIVGAGGIAVSTSGSDVVVDGSGVAAPAAQIGVATDSGVLGSYTTLLLRGGVEVANSPPGPTNTGTVVVTLPTALGGLSNLGGTGGNSAQVFEGLVGSVSQTARLRRIVGTGGLAVTQTGTDIVLSGAGFLSGIPTSGVVPGTYAMPRLVVGADGRITEAQNGDAVVTSVSLAGAEFSFAGGPITSAGTISLALAPSGVSAGTYSLATVAVDAKGRVTSVSNGSFSGVASVAVVGNADIASSGGPITSTGTIALSLTSTGVAPGSYDHASVVVDARGRLSFARSNTPVTSVAIAAGPGVAVSGGPVTSQGTLTVGLATLSAGGTFALANIVVDAFGRVVAAANGSASGNGITALTVTGGGDLDIAGSPLVSAGTIGLSLATTGVAPGTYTRVSVDAKGRVVAGGQATFVSSVAIAPGDGVTIQGAPVTSAGTFTVGLAPSGVAAGTYGVVAVDSFGRVVSGSEAASYVSSVALAAGVGVTVQGGPITASGTLSVGLAPTGVAAGTYNVVAVDALGRVTAASLQDPVLSIENLGDTGPLGQDVGLFADFAFSAPPPGLLAQFRSLRAGNGIAFGSDSQRVTIGLAPSGVAAGTFALANIVVDAFGRVLSASNGSATGNGITALTITGSSGLSVFGSPLMSAGTIALSLSDTGVAPGTYSSVTVDAQGRVVAGAQSAFVSSVALAAGAGVTIQGAPVTSAGTFTVGLVDSGVAPGTYTLSTVEVDRFGRVVAASAGSAPVSVTLVAAASNTNIVSQSAAITSEGTLAFDLTTTGVVPGTYPLATVVVDGFGRVRSASAGTASGNGITALTLTGSDFTFSGSPLTSAGTIDFGLAPVGTAGTYERVITDGKGRVTGGTAWRRVTVSDATYTLDDNDTYLGVTRTRSGPCNIAFGPGVEGRRVTVKDEGGNAFANNIVITSGNLIDGLPSTVMDTNHQSLTLLYSGGGWWLI